MRTENDNWDVPMLKVSYNPQKTGIFLSNSNDAYEVLLNAWDWDLLNVQEQFYSMYLTPANELIGVRLISTGTITSSTVDIPLVISCAVGCRAATIIIAHNHPCGDCRPSREDVKVTEAIQQVTRPLGICLSDHIILSENSYVSFADYSAEQPEKKKRFRLFGSVRN